MLEAFEIVSSAVADPSRVRILKLLEPGELCVCQITAVLDLAPATISKHLALLKSAGLVQQRREGKWVYYRLAGHALNDYARPFLSLVANSLCDDSTIAEDRRLLALVLATPVQLVCEQGRAALSQAAVCCNPSRSRSRPNRVASTSRENDVTPLQHRQSKRSPRRSP